MSKPCAFNGQSLVSHITGSLGIARVLIDEGYVDTVSTRLATALRYGVDPEMLRGIARDMIEISVIFHDIGKALKAYQDSYDDNCICNHNKCHFSYHEVFSAFYLYKFLVKLAPDIYKFLMKLAPDMDGLLKPMFALPLMSVINHMHGMMMRSYGALMGKIKYGDYDFVRILRRGAYIENGYVEKLAKEILGLKSKYYGVDVGIDTLVKVFSARVNSVDDLYYSMKYIEHMSSMHGWSKLYILVLVPLSIGDNCDSVSSRLSDPSESGGRKTYIQELCCNSLGYDLGSRVSGIKICGDRL